MSRTSRKLIPDGSLVAVPLEPLNITRMFLVVPPERIILQYSCHREDVAEYLGIIFTASLFQLESNDRVEAVRVGLPDGIPFTAEIPHITLSQISDKVGLLESVEMLKRSSNRIKNIGTAQFRIELLQFSYPEISLQSAVDDIDRLLFPNKVRWEDLERYR